ncbi:glycoside hydrolase family 3 C-terminal domain-containing protein [Clostridium sp. YIM B02505]|uniref:Glycoside hydrolase family 3 C-terminal domain-containing protein n=1 Tax=Clostridium yunnanense TaxID=2800325 RepID=A0ABS1EKU2_9CLOT|nr:glycoside hydrolase family 3 C-terminal domain-containing protein [Clostridium yunnanense]MBK1809981.1 glycoside hydrolase family 3 C-terminal domain-containing protein [Clostridium yunnanense]
MKHRKIIEKMSLEEKIALCSGKSFWETQEFPEYGIKSLFLADGPHGLRKQVGESDHLGLNASIATTCFPTASAVAATWDVELIREMGDAIGKEAVKEDINIVLGPGVNMKRNPLCGRNFEYFSEDPFLSGKIGSAWIKGVQSNGVGTSLKHFALNNQELKRMSTDVLVDERALMEYYLPAFEIAVKESEPTSVMCAYNKIEGTYCSDNKRLIWDILREEWGFDGAVITDWGAMNDRIEAFKAGLDLEMPGSKGRFDKEVKKAVENGLLDERYIDQAVDNLLTLIDRTTKGNKNAITEDLHNKNHQLARKVAAAGGVLLRNQNKILPLEKKSQITVIGELAKTPRYQGNGSSLVSPTKLSNLLDGISEYTETSKFASGYSLKDIENEDLIKEAVEIAKSSKTVVLCVGLTDIYESEGFDREHMGIPKNQAKLIEAVAEVNENIIVIIVGGSAIEMPWAEKVQAILHMQLSGQAGGLAAADLIFGNENPSGKLTETYPFRYEDVVSSTYFNKNPKQGAYFESMYCGYRYFETAKVPVRYPFGFGLSYTEFKYSNLQVKKSGLYDVEVTANVENVGEFDGAEVVQLYVAAATGGVYRPSKELKGFAKVQLEKGESKQVRFNLDKRSFAVYDQDKKDWIVEEGIYALQIGASIKNVRLEKHIELEGEKPVRKNCSTWYYSLSGIPSKKDFVTIYHNYEDYVPQVKGTYDMTSSIKEMKETSLICKIMYKAMEKIIAKNNGGKVDYTNPGFRMLMDSASDNPMKSMPLFSPDSMSLNVAEFFVEAANGHMIKGIKKLTKKNK